MKRKATPKPRGFQPQAAKAHRLKDEHDLLMMLMESAIIRFHATYPSLKKDDWFNLLVDEGLMREFLEQKRQMPDSLEAALIQRNSDRETRGMPALFSTGLPCKDVDRLHQILNALAEFVEIFDLVFDADWEMTKGCIADAVQQKAEEKEDYWFGDRGTFVHPTIEDTSNNWSNRGHLLSTYRTLKAMISELEPPYCNFDKQVES